MPGRKKGSPNLQRKGKKIINKHDVAFSEKEKRKLESLVNSANRKRRRMLQQEADLPRMLGGKDTGQKIKDLQTMGKESDFILAKKSKSLHKFRSKEEYRRYIKNLSRVVDRDYIAKRVELYRKNQIKALKNIYGKDAAPVIKILKKLSLKDYMRAVQSDELLELEYLYDPREAAAKLGYFQQALTAAVEK